MKTLLTNVTICKDTLNLLIDGELIAYIGNDTPPADTVINLEGKMLISGGIDMHVHVRDMELEYKEDWLTASKAALAGGYTTIFDMPNTMPATLNEDSLNFKRAAAQKSLVNKGYFIGANRYNYKEIEHVLLTAPQDVPGIKAYLAGSSSNEVVSEEEILLKLCQLAKKYDLPLAVHSEDQRCITQWTKKQLGNHARYHSQIRNRECAIKSTSQILNIASSIGNKLYLAHVSTAEEIDLVVEHKKRNPYIYCEVTPHHLFLSEEILETVGNYGKVNPPIRTKADNEALLQAIINGVADTIGSDHAPHSLEEKNKEYKSAPSGFPGLETTMALLLNAVNKGILPLNKIVKLCSSNPAKIFKLKNRGKIEVGYFADLAIVDMKKKWIVNPENFFTKAKYSPYCGMELQGKVVMTFVNGKLLYNELETA